MSKLRNMVLQSFKKLHRTRVRVFEGDQKALTAARLRINEEYKKNKHVSDAASIEAMIQFSVDVEKELRTQVIQAREIKPGVFEARITENTLKLDNISYNEAASSDPTDRPPAAPAPCCQQAQHKHDASPPHKHII